MARDDESSSHERGWLNVVGVSSLGRLCVFVRAAKPWVMLTRLICVKRARTGLLVAGNHVGSHGGEDSARSELTTVGDA